MIRVRLAEKEDLAATSEPRSARWCLRLAVVAVVVGWSRLAQAQIGEGELVARLSWLMLLPLGLVQMILAVTLRQHLTRDRVGATGFATSLSLAVGLIVAIFVEDPEAVAVLLACLTFAPGAPMVADLVRQRAWRASILMFLLLPVPVSLVILEGASR